MGTGVSEHLLKLCLYFIFYFYLLEEHTATPQQWLQSWNTCILPGKN